jgi:hypothetical protein
MKKQSNNFLTQLAAEQIESLTTVVNETLAREFKLPAAKIFTAADLWNIQKQKKATGIRRHGL